MRKCKYKVVTEKNKSCSVAPHSIFCLYYKKDTNVFALEETLGVMVFKQRYFAQKFIEEYDFVGKWKIKRVIPIGRGKKPVAISYSPLAIDLRKFYKGIGLDHSPPIGTICYPGVYVVD